MCTVTDNAVTNTTAAAAAPVQAISGGQIVAKMLKQDGIKHIFRWPGSAVN
jgi:hypothetical protein